MQHLLRPTEWLLGAIERLAYKLRLALYYRRIGIVPKDRGGGTRPEQAKVRVSGGGTHYVEPGELWGSVKFRAQIDRFARGSGP